MLEQCIYNTVRWWSLFDRPVTAVELWRAMVVYTPEKVSRWQGLKRPGLREVQRVLAESVWLRERIGSRWGYLFLKGREDSVDAYLRRHRIAQLKWRLTRRIARWLIYVPFGRGIFGSGSLAVMNTRPESDLDLFVVAKGGRIWTTRLFMLTVAQLTGRRRRYWEGRAPDKVCLNHYVTDAVLETLQEDRNLYTAMLYTHFVPLAEREMRDLFVNDNKWIKRFVMYPEMPGLASVLSVRSWPWLMIVRRWVEKLLMEPVGDMLEKWAERIQRRSIEKHSGAGRSGRVHVSDTELAFHPGHKVAAVLTAYEQDPAQGKLLTL